MEVSNLDLEKKQEYNNQENNLTKWVRKKGSNRDLKKEQEYNNGRNNFRALFFTFIKNK